MVFCRILGPIEVEIDGGLAELGGPVPRRLLAALAAGAGAPVPHSVLAEVVWGAEPSAEVMNAIRVSVHRLRTALGPRARGYLQSTPQGYRLALAPEATDYARFEQWVAQGTEALATADPSAAVRALESALALWRGRPWAELGESLWVSGLRARMAELRETAVEELQAARLACGDTARAVAALSQAVVEAPYRERRWELLALGLYRTGRQGHALAELRRVRVLLRDELGAEPGAALRELEKRMLAHDPGLLIASAAERADEPEPAGPRPPPRPTVARPLSRLIGRRRELSLLDAAVTESRLVTITGPAGVGKTRLAAEHAADRADARLVRLADVRSAEAVAPTVAAALGVTQTSGDPFTALARLLGDRPELLVLDNCEHLVDALAGIVPTLLARCPRLRILATGRQALGMDGEQVIALAPLPTGGEGSAVELLFDRVRAMRAGWVPTGPDTAAAATICTALDGLPLAIELAAARARAFGLADIAAQVSERFDALGTSSRGSVSPHDSLVAAIAWSVDQLPATDRALLLRLWPFDGGFSWEAAESVRPVDADGAVFAGLAALVDRSVLTAEVSSGHVRYRLLETVRRYCREADTDRAATLRAHAGWVRSFVAEQASLLDGPRYTEAVQVLAGELANFRAGIAHDLEHAPARALRTTGALRYLWVSAGPVPEWRRLLQRALDACPDAQVEDRAAALIGLSLTSNHVGAAEAALSAAEAALGLLDDDDPAHDRLLLEAHLRRCNTLADADAGAGEPSRRAALAFKAACDRRDPPGFLRASALWGIALVHFRDGDTAAVVDTLTSAREIAARCGFASGEGISDLLLAWCLLADPEQPRAGARQALGLLVRAVAAFERQPNGSEELAALYAGVFALAVLDASEAAARLHAAVADHAERNGTDPARYLRFAGPDLAERMEQLVKVLPPTESGHTAWDEMVGLFTGAAAALSGQP
ncbi:BTAD domain-containing putative transcriptional regulator [Streptomyces sp. 1331.2]|uniref:BTAD domain-containing putative transcriptional regulator n=1 Tax=Streptomyces sp. 1331.2 TaxID=1938835 RepID=UPI000BD42440|nr:BTAD domain-containing putative transcriptional regulator [Streptomyces sp. 1331.2]SOB88818.1 Predicted ATPase [Streptomyces sp. 1331.2]